MAISTNAAVEFFGTQDTVTGSSSSVAIAAFSVAGDVTAWANDDDAPMANVVFTGTFAAAPSANSVVNLFARAMNVDSTTDTEIPSANNLSGHLGAFLLRDTTSAQTHSIDVRLPNAKSSAEYEFYIQNLSGQSLNSGWTLKVTPKTFGPHA